MAEMNPQVVEAIREAEAAKHKVEAARRAVAYEAGGPVTKLHMYREELARQAREQGGAAPARRKTKKISLAVAVDFLRQYATEFGLVEADLERGLSKRARAVLHEKGYTVGGHKPAKKGRKAPKHKKTSKSGSKPRKGSKAARKAAGKKAAATRKRNHAKRSAAAKKAAKTRRKNSKKPAKKRSAKKSGGKKRRSAKQKANDKRLGKMAKARARGK